MGRILAIDYGTKRTGIAVTDPGQIIASALATVETFKVIEFLDNYRKKEPLDKIIIGLPLRMNGEPSDSEVHIKDFIRKLKKVMPDMEMIRYDERFTSKIAARTMLEAGYKKKQRQDKKRLDSMSATLILQSYLQSVQ